MTTTAPLARRLALIGRTSLTAPPPELATLIAAHLPVRAAVPSREGRMAT